MFARSEELTLLDGFTDSAALGVARPLLVAGEAGMGKTLLTEELLDRARSREVTVLLARCWETVDAPPYWPWVQIVRQARATCVPGSDGEAAAEDVLASLGDPDVSASEGSSPSPRIRLFDEVARLLESIAARSPLIVAVEDLHASDLSSLLLLQYLAKETHGVAIFGTFDAVLVKARAGLLQPLNEIGWSGRLIQLGPLSEDEVRRMYSELSGSDSSDAMATAVYQASEGNPLFVEETVRMLTMPGGLHRPDHSTGFRVPEGARGVMRRRLESLPENIYRCLAVAAVIGREFDVSTLQTVGGEALEDVLGSLDEAVRSGLIVETSALGLYSFTHLLLRETLYESLGAAERMRLHRMVAETLEAAYGGAPDRHLMQLAHHWFKAAQAGDPSKTMDYTVQAAEHAVSIQAYEEAVRLYRRAVQVGEIIRLDRARMQTLQGAIAAAVAATETGQPAGEGGSGDNAFRREGDYWTIVFGGATSRLKDSKGMRHLVQLLKNPGQEMHVLALAAEGSRSAPTGHRGHEDATSDGLGDGGPVLDATAKASYKRRFTDLSEELEEARSFNDTERAAGIQAEIDAIVDQLAVGVGLGGRDRKMASQSERARVSVTKNVKEAVRRIGDSNRLLGDHLRSAVKTGTYCSYQPDPRVPITWQT